MSLSLDEQIERLSRLTPANEDFDKAFSIWEGLGAEFYRQFYKYEAHNHGRLRAVYDRLVDEGLMPDLAGTAVLDWGCGSGELLRYSKADRDTSLGVDKEPEALKVARQNAPDYIFSDSIYERGYDYIVAMEVFEHLRNPVGALDDVLLSVFDWKKVFIVVPHGRLDGYFGHINFWSPESLARDLGLDGARTIPGTHNIVGWINGRY